jgi:hypothetical protein
MMNLPAEEYCKLTKAKTFLLLQFCTFELLSAKHTMVRESKLESQELNQGTKNRATSKVPSYLLLLHI